MDPTVANPIMGFRARFKRLMFVQRSEKDCRVYIESLYKHLSRPPDSKVQVTFTEYPIDADYAADNVRKRKKSIKPRRLRPRWLRSSKRLLGSLPRRCADSTLTVDSKYLVSMPQSVPRGDDGDDDDRPPEYSDHGSTDPGLHVFLGGCAGDDASWKVRYAAVECVDSAVHSHGPDDCTDPRPIIRHIQPATELGTSEDYFQNFYHTLEPFISDVWGNLFRDDDADDAGVSRVISRRHDHDQHSPPPPPPPPPPTQTTTEGCNSAGPNRLSQAAPLLGLQTRNSFSTHFLATVGTWDIDELHKSTSLQPTPDTEPRKDVVHTVSNFDHTFQVGDAAAPTAEWRTLKLEDFESTGIKKSSAKSTESGQSSSDGAARSLQDSGSVNQNLPLKRGRHEEDPNERKKRKRKDEGPRNPPGPPVGKEETFPCPFKYGSPSGSDKVVKACSTNFPNQSKLKEHIRRAHLRHLKCPHQGCTYCAGTPFEVNRHQEARHPLPLKQIEQTTNLDNFHKNKALGLKNLTPEMISEICFSIEYTRNLLERLSSEVDCESNPECERDEIEDEGGDEVPSLASNSEISETDENTPADFGNGDASEKHDNIVGPLVDNEEYPDSADGYNTSPPSNKSRNEAPQSNDRYETQKASLFIHKKFEEMRCKLIPTIVAYLGSPENPGFNKEADAVFERLYQTNYGILTECNVYSIPDPQTDCAPPASQCTHVRSSTLNMYHEYESFPSSSQTCFGPTQIYPGPYWGQIGTDTPMYSERENSATTQDLPQSPDSRANELLLDMVPPSSRLDFVSD